jgi:hypothetical protein
MNLDPDHVSATRQDQGGSTSKPYVPDDVRREFCNHKFGVIRNAGQAPQGQLRPNGSPQDVYGVG